MRLVVQNIEITVLWNEKEFTGLGKILALTTLLLLCMGAVSAQGTTILDEEDGNLTDYGWGGEEGRVSTVTSPALKDVYAAEGAISNGNNWWMAKNVSSVKTSWVSFYIRAEALSNGDDAYFGAYSGTPSSSTSIWYIDMTNGCVSYGNYGTDSEAICLRSASTGTYYKVNVSQIDWDNNQIGEIKVDGTVEATNVAFYNSADGVDVWKYGIFSPGSYSFYLDYVKRNSFNEKPSFDSVSVSPSSWTLGSSVDFSVNVSDDGVVSGVNASVWENSSEIESDVSLSDSGGDGVWEVSDLFSVDEGDVWYNVSITAADDSGATAVEWVNKSVVGSELSWSDESGNEDGFRVYSNISSSDFVEVGSVGSGRTEFTYATSALSFGDSRCFQVTAFNSYGESSPVQDCFVP